MLLWRTNTVVRLSWFTPKKPRVPPPPLPPVDSRPQAPIPHIADAFRQFIHNNIPVRLLDTTKLEFVERDDIFSLFSSQIARITEEDVQKRMCTVGVDMHPEAGNYIGLRKVALREIIRDVVRYAIFSHRWTAGEPTYQDVRTPGRLSFGRQRNIRTAGLAKLAQLCDTARKLGYRLVWSDTCCIDKSNPNELSEAIHAMFRWYAHAHMCIVHLGASSSLSDFQHEPWFKRGWTLQELLAPRRIKFYNCSWHPLTRLANDKDDLALMYTLSAVTDIPRDVIMADNSRGIRGRGAWEIMSWASSRKTTRIEDAAYCLFGLFDINLPIAYGEGEKVFPKFIEAIIARHRYRGWDVFAWAGEASERHPALPSAPACYPKWEEAMMTDEVGMTEFALTSHGLRLTSVPLIPLAFVSEVKTRDGSYIVTLRPRPFNSTISQVGMFGDVRVDCGSGRLPHLRDATDLHACILNYKPGSDRHASRGMLQVGRKYVCFLLHMKSQNAECESTWLKFATDNVLHIACSGSPGREDGMFDLPLEKTFIRAPRAQSTLWAA